MLFVKSVKTCSDKKFDNDGISHLLLNSESSD